MTGHPPSPNLHYLPNGGAYIVGPWRVAALGGTFAPSWYHSPVASLPPSRGRRVSSAAVKLGKSRDDKRRHFVRDEVLACKALTGIDVFLTHEAPRPFYPGGKRIDTGKTVINEVLDVDAPATAPVRASSRVHRLGASGRSLDWPRPGHEVVFADRCGHASV